MVKEENQLKKLSSNKSQQTESVGKERKRERNEYNKWEYK